MRKLLQPYLKHAHLINGIKVPGGRIFGTNPVSAALYAILGWTAGESCASALPGISTVKLSKDATFTDPDVGWTFTKTSAGRQLVTDIEFDNTLVDGAPPLDGNWYNTSSSPANYTLGGKLYVASGDAIVTLAKETLEANKDYNLVVDIDEPASGFSLSVALGGSIVSGNISTAGVHAITLTTAGTLTNNNIGLVNLGTPEIVVNSISVIEVTGPYEEKTGVDVASATASDTDVIAFDVNWDVSPTYGDVVKAIYDADTVGADYADPSKLIEVLGDEHCTDPLMEGSLGVEWDGLVGTPVLTGTQLEMEVNEVCRGTALFPWVEGTTYRCTIDCGTISVDSVRLLLNATEVIDLDSTHSNKVVVVDFVMPVVSNQYLAFSTTLTGGSGVIKGLTVQPLTQEATPMEDTSLTLTNCLDAS